MQKRVDLYHNNNWKKNLIVIIMIILIATIGVSYLVLSKPHKKVGSSQINTATVNKKSTDRVKKRSSDNSEKTKIANGTNFQQQNMDNPTSDSSDEQLTPEKQAEYNHEKFRNQKIAAQNATHAMLTNSDGTRSYVTKNQAEQQGTLTTIWDVGPDGDAVPVYDSNEIVNKNDDGDSNTSSNNVSNNNLNATSNDDQNGDDDYEVTPSDDEKTVTVRNKKTGETIQKKAVSNPDWDYVHDRQISQLN